MVSSEENHDIRAQHGVPREALLIGTIANLLPLKGYEDDAGRSPSSSCRHTDGALSHHWGWGSRVLRAIESDNGGPRDCGASSFLAGVSKQSVASYLSALDLYALHPLA